jgi:hypothetical protein
VPPALTNALTLAVIVVLTSGCADGLPTAVAGEKRRTPPPGAVTSRVSPLHDQRGLHPSLTSIPDAERPLALALLDNVSTAGRGSKTAYERDAFGEAWSDAADTTWGHDGCRTREEILHRDLRAVTLRPGTRRCVVLDGLLNDPYTAHLIEFSKSRPLEVQVDHVIPLYYAWQLGAARWTAHKRLRIANDPLNLLAVDGSANQQKSASGPAAWLPHNKRIRCAYAVRIAQVALKYKLPVTLPDKQMMLRQCRRDRAVS